MISRWNRIGRWNREIVVSSELIVFSSELGMRLLRMRRYLYPSKGRMFRPQLVRDVA